jgi:hypothetical protein
MTPSTALLNDLVKIVDKFVRKIKKDRKGTLLRDMRRTRGIVDYYTQHGSLVIGLPRRNGNTTLALKLLKKYPKSVYIACNRSMYADAAKRYGIEKRRFFSVAMIDLSLLLPYDTEIVITEALCYAKESAISRMYQSLDRHHPIYIHLGTTK